MEKNVGQRLIIIAVVIIIAAALLYPPSEKLRPGLDIAGGTSLIFEIDTEGATNDPEMAERLKLQLANRVDPKGVYDLKWRVHGNNRLEVQMPLPPKDALARRAAYEAALEQLYAHELKRGKIEATLRLPAEQRAGAIQELARGNAERAIAALPAGDAATLRSAIDQVVAARQQSLTVAAERWDAKQAADAAVQAAAASQPTTAEAAAPPVAEELQLKQQEATELYEDAVQEVLSQNLNRRRFEEILELDKNSPTRQTSMVHIRTVQHPDLQPELDAAIDAHAAYRSGRQYLDSSADLKRLLQGAGELEFRILPVPDPGNPTKFDRYRKQLEQGSKVRAGEEFGWFRVDNPMQFFDFDSPADLATFKPEQHGRYVAAKFDEHYYVLAHLATDYGLLQKEGQRPWRLVRARVDRDEHNRWSVAFELNDIGGQLFSQLTRANIEKPLAILVDDIMYSAPNIKSEIRTHGQITGDFSLEKVNYLVRSMEGGTLPARLKDTPLSERTIGSSLGEVNRASAVRAGLIGTLAVVVIMIGYYLVCGLVANVALALNVLLVLAAMALLQARITLDGIAGIILSVGMAVDANVLIYERMREEKERGASLRMMIKNGYDKALSTIFDSNVTTLLTCIIIYYVGSEEVKGFGLTLGWGIALNLFTSVFVTRTIFTVLLRYNVIKDLKMAKLFGVPNVDWYSMRKVFLPLSAVAIIGGMALLFSRGASLFDVEFRGGVAAELELKRAGLNDQTIRERLGAIGEQIAADAARLGAVQVQPVGTDGYTFDLRLDGVDPERLAAFITEPLQAQNVVARGGRGVELLRGEGVVRVNTQEQATPESLTDRIKGFTPAVAEDGRNLNDATVNAVIETTAEAQGGLIWNVTTTATNMRLVEHAIASALGDDMKVQPSIDFVFRGQEDRPFPITDRLLSAVVPGLPAGVEADLTDLLGGSAMVFEQLDPPQSVQSVQARLNSMHFQPDFAGQPKRDALVVGVTPAAGQTDEQGEPLYTGIVIATADPDIRFSDDPEAWYSGVAEPEFRLATQALAKEQTLRKVMQFKPQIAARSTQQAAVALLLSWAMIIGYVWIRFGKPRYGVAGVVALVHDVLIALTFVGLSGALAGFFLISDFKINMPIIAALLTIIGFSINDTIVIFDRIREVRGRLGVVTPQVVNDSINQCMSRTILTTLTVLVVVLIMYIFGGASIRGFNYCMLIGCISGTYSTIVIAGPILLLQFSRMKTPAPAVPARA